MNTTTYADYQVLSPASFTLDASLPTKKKVELMFETYDNTRLVSDERRPLLQFLVRVHELTQLKIFINSHEVLAWQLAVDTAIKGLWVPIPAAVAFPDNQTNNKTIRFSVSTQGRIDVSHVVWWTQVVDAG